MLSKNAIRGALAEIAVMQKLVGAGMSVYRPLTDSQRSDFVVDTGTEVLRIQVKSTIGSTIKLQPTRSSKYKDIGDFDVYALVFCEDEDDQPAIFLVPKDMVAGRSSLNFNYYFFEGLHISDWIGKWTENAPQ